MEQTLSGKDSLFGTAHVRSFRRRLNKSSHISISGIRLQRLEQLGSTVFAQKTVGFQTGFGLKLFKPVLSKRPEPAVLLQPFLATLIQDLLHDLHGLPLRAKPQSVFT